MSVPGAVAELNKEIADLKKRITHLIQIRDSLLKDGSAVGTRGQVKATAVAPVKTKGKKTTTKTATAKKSIPVKAVATKRVVSAATRKKMSDAAKARAAAKKAKTAK